MIKFNQTNKNINLYHAFPLLLIDRPLQILCHHEYFTMHRLIYYNFFSSFENSLKFTNTILNANTFKYFFDLKGRNEFIPLFLVLSLRNLLMIIPYGKTSKGIVIQLQGPHHHSFKDLPLISFLFSKHHS